jgi:hypothetical protein
MIEITKTALPPLVVPAEGDPPESLSDLARDYPGLVVVGGIALGLLVGALLPRGTARRLAQGAVAAAAASGEAGLSLARSARARAESAASDAGEQLAELKDEAATSAGKLRRRASRAAGDASGAGLDIARAGLRLLSSLRH